MALAYLLAENVRCVARAELELDARHNLIYGENGSGKTSLLEAAFLLGRGRSFRTRNSERLIRHGESRLVAFGRTDATPPLTVGVQVARGEPTLAKVGGTEVQSLAELPAALPIQVIEPRVHALLEEGSPRRRRWMDWAVFHVEHNFAADWSRYGRALKQRNAALRRDPREASAWEPELARLGERLARSRRSLLEQLQPHWLAMVRALAGREVTLHYAQGWPQDSTLAEALEGSRPRDLQRGLTHMGPHRADVHIRLEGRAAREILSRGQQKVVAIAMILAQLTLLKALTGTSPTLLLDDPAAELDGARLAAFVAQIEALQCQLIATSLTPERGLFTHSERLFHVEQGRVKTL